MKLNKNVELNETGYIINSITGDSFSVNETGRAIFEKLQQNLTREEIIESFLDDFQSDPTQITRNTDEFIAKLHQFQLIE